LSYRDVEELLSERGIEVDHVTSTAGCRRSRPSSSTRHARHATPAVIDGSSMRPTSRSPAAGPTSNRAIDQHRQVIDVLVSQRRDARAAQAFFTRALTHGASPVEVTTDRAPVYPRVMDPLVPTARHVTEQDANNTVEADHARLKGRPRPMRALTTIASLDAVATGHAFVQNPHRGHYPITADPPIHDRVRVASTELALRR
jgi:IS6 family transposase